LEAALGSIEHDGEQSPFAFGAKWLLLAYGKIKGEDAFQRLQRLMANARASFIRPALDQSAALALGLTSFVSNSSVPPALRMIDGRVFYCRAQEPRDALNQLIVAWNTNNRQSVESSLGPIAGAAMASLIARRSWDDFRTEIWRDGHPVGYKFEWPGRWSDAEETLEEDGSNTRRTGDPSIPTDFRNSAGGTCGKQVVRFLDRGSVRDGSLVFLINNPDIESLLRTISTCASK
jgi:hypothetical protein